MKYRVVSLILILAALLGGYFIYKSEINPNSRFNFKFGLDLSGGSHLVYQADISKIDASEISGAMESLRDTIERRVNLFGVSEPIVQVEEGGVIGSAGNQRLIVELPGVTDVDEAIKLIGQTPLLEFKLLKEGIEIDESTEISDDLFVDTGLTGRFL